MEKELKFKTNIKCMGCVEKVAPALNETVGPDNWSVDLASPDKPLTIKGAQADAATVVQALASVGYTAQAAS